MTIQVVETEHGFEITWDPNDPVESVLSEWTEEVFMKVIMDAARDVLAEHTFEGDFLEK